MLRIVNTTSATHQHVGAFIARIVISILLGALLGLTTASQSCWHCCRVLFFQGETTIEAMKITVSKELQTSETLQWNTQTNGNWGMETKGLCRSV